MSDHKELRLLLENEMASAFVRGLEAAMGRYTHLAPEFAMIAAQQWCESYQPGQNVRLFGQRSEVLKFQAGHTDMLVLRRDEHFPFVHPIEVTLR